MSIEIEIKQNIPFTDEREKALVNLIYTQNWLNHHLKLFFKPYDITPKQYNILRILRGTNRAMSTSEIRRRMLDKMSDISRIIDRMVKKQVVKKKICPSDKRLVDIEITKTKTTNLTTTINNNNNNNNTKYVPRR